MTSSYLIVISVLVCVITGEMFDEHNIHYFHVSSSSKLIVTTDVQKYGDYAMKWCWKARDVLTLDLSHDAVKGRQLYEGGIKVWFYQRTAINNEMTVSFNAHVNSSIPTLPECYFNISLKFAGWRAVWVGFQECKRRRRISSLQQMQIQAPDGETGELYIDLLHIVRSRFGWQSRDNIVPPIRTFRAPRNIWLQTYHWSQIKPKIKIFNELELTADQLHQLKEIRLIKRRLRDWYRVPGKSTYELTGYHRKRWMGIRARIKHARKYWRVLNITKTSDGFIKGPALFARNSAYGKVSANSREIKFGFVFRNVLLPLALEYHFATRKEEIVKILQLNLPKIKDLGKQRRKIEKLTGFDREFMGLFYSKDTSLTKHRMRKALMEMNKRRFSRLVRILEYTIDQGWDEGSALGSLDHEMNRSSKGFVTSIFLLQKSLFKAGLLRRLIGIMKWYLEFGELYQQPYKFPGTTADRLRTLFLYRLMCVLIMPETSTQEVLEKLQDMSALKAWYENALSINPALGGTIKPDCIGYHHKSFYPNDYVLPGLLTAAHVAYIVRGTAYELSWQRREDLKNAIHFMRLLSEKYVFPNSVTNASPTHAKPELICLIPAFAYVAMWQMRSHDLPLRRDITHRKHTRLCTRSSYKQSIRNQVRLCDKFNTFAVNQHVIHNTPHKQTLQAFLRLFDENDVNIQRYLGRGKGCAWKTSYTHTLGSLSLLYELKKYAKDHGIKAELTPQGNWAKNFAALSIHRRQSWVVTMKGFNNFVWGSESSINENKYGRYQSYGQLLIANTDQGLKAHDIHRGWDWNRLPGTTTLRLPLTQLHTKMTRYYNPRSLCGGVNFQGTSGQRNGVFTMDFERPHYGHGRTKFWFKKSVFFYENLVLCLGSNIRAMSFREVETTLFQNTAGDASNFIIANGHKIPLGSHQYGRKLIWSDNSPGILMDANKNGYYIPNGGRQKLNLWFLNQTSPDTQASRYYATAVLRHGKYPKGVTYEYAILVNSSYKHLYRLACLQHGLCGQPRYKILRQDYRAHIVQLNDSPRFGRTTYGYSIFTASTRLRGPLRMVGDPCVLMVEDGGVTSTRLVIAVSYPQLNFNMTRKLKTSYDARDEELYYMRSQEKHIWVMLRSRVQRNALQVYIDGRILNTKDHSRYIRIFSVHEGTRAVSMVYFKNLLNGFTTEVHLKRMENRKVEV